MSLLIPSAYSHVSELIIKEETKLLKFSKKIDGNDFHYNSLKGIFFEDIDDAD
jgi:hypothetical protein